MSEPRAAKDLVQRYFDRLETASESGVAEVLALNLSPSASWKAVHPFNELTGPKQVHESFWGPFRAAWRSVQRRQDVLFAGENRVGNGVWVVSMGHFMGLFDRPWLGLPATGRMAMLRYAEFNRVANRRIVESGFFLDLVGLMEWVGLRPLPQATGQHFAYPGPRTHDGIVRIDQDPEETRRTHEVLDRMIDDLDALNRSGEDRCPPKFLARCWHEDMIWYGPAGIGASMTIPRYQQQHQYPFREGLQDKRFNGHVCRVAEGRYAGFFGWPNLTNRAAGGFLGLPASDGPASMRVVDIYRREGDKLMENWVFIDLPHWLKQQGVDVLRRTAGLGRAP